MWIISPWTACELCLVNPFIHQLLSNFLMDLRLTMLTLSTALRLTGSLETANYSYV
jgi:hypothetical protein